MKEWMTLKNRIGRTYLRFGWQCYLWYDKVKNNVDFKNHVITCDILRVWNNYETSFFPKIFLLPPQKAFLEEK